MTGGTGQLGFELRCTEATLGKFLAPSCSEFDLANPESVSRHVRTQRQVVILNAAVYTAVDKSEHSEEAARVMNACAPELHAREGCNSGVLFAHDSTDYIFDGTMCAPYVEDDTADARHCAGLLSAVVCDVCCLLPLLVVMVLIRFGGTWPSRYENSTQRAQSGGGTSRA